MAVVPGSDPVEVGATRLWEREVHGTAGQHPMFDPDGAAVYVSDGWGRRPAPALRFRRLDIGTGDETANWPCGSVVRCLVRLERDLLVATDQRLARLDAVSLVEQARWDRSVRHATSVAVWDGVAVAGDPVTPSVTLVDLRTGTARRKRHGPIAAILGRSDDAPILVAAGDRGLALADTTTGTIRPLRSTPPAMAAALSEDERGVWVIAGRAVRITEDDGGASMRPGEPVREAQWHPLGTGVPRTIQVPVPVRTIAVGRDALWLTPAAIPWTTQYVAIGSAVGDDWRIWRAPDRALVQAVAPKPGLALTSTHEAGSETTILSCYRIREGERPGG
jgi:hypothetical protein